MKLIIVLLVTFSIFSSTYGEKNDEPFKCPPNEVEKFDKITSQILSLNHYQRKFPENTTILGPYCE